MADAENIVQTMGLRPEWPNFGVISLAHSYGFSNLVTPLLLHGIPLILSNSALPESLRQATGLGGEGITVPAVPALWRIWHEARVITDQVRLSISAGAPLPLKLLAALFKATALEYAPDCITPCETPARISGPNKSMMYVPAATFVANRRPMTCPVFG